MWILLAAFALIRDRNSLVRVRADISVPWSATYVTNVRYSLGESRVRYVRGARLYIIYPRVCPRRALRHRVVRASADRRACNTRLRLARAFSQEEKSVREEARHRNTGGVRIRIRFLITRRNDDSQEDDPSAKCRGRGFDRSNFFSFKNAYHHRDPSSWIFSNIFDI